MDRMHTGRERHKHSFRRKALLVLLCVLLAVGGAEILTRVTRITPPLAKEFVGGAYVPDSHLPYRLRPNFKVDVLSRSGEFRMVASHNSAGFRDIEHALRKPPGTFRILGLGDSFTYGSGARFEETYLFVLEQLFNEKAASGIRVEVVKAGIGGFFTEPERLLLEHHGLAYEPDLLLVGFNSTDLFETFRGIEAVTLHDGYLKSAAARKLGHAGTFLYLHSHVARLAFSAWQRQRARREAAALEEHIDEVWLEVEDEFGKMKSIMAHRDGHMAVCYIPVELPPPDNEIARLADMCRRHGIVFADATPFLERAASGGPVFWPKDGHCTPRGYRAIAESILNGQGDVSTCW